MRLFDVKAYGKTAMLAHPDRVVSTVGGFRAPGPGVLVIEEGNVWVALADGSRQNVSAKSVVVYEADDWVEYCSYGPQPFRTRNYWAAAEPFEDSERRLEEIFGGSTPVDAD